MISGDVIPCSLFGHWSEYSGDYGQITTEAHEFIALAFKFSKSGVDLLALKLFNRLKHKL
ncbi:MAG: hypothetical protein ACLS36_05190 [Streptococcus sp.]